MFDGVARRYDLTNTVLTAGQDRRWRALTRDALDLRPGERVLDLAAGTAVSTVSLARSGAWCVAADFSLGHAACRRRPAPSRRSPPTPCALPFADAAFDAVTISFGLRNVADPDAALAELARVTRPGGRLVVCEFGTPTWAPYRAAYHDVVLKHALPAVARAVSSNPEAYLYLAESIRAWPAQPALARSGSRRRAGRTSAGATSRAAPSPCTGRADPGRADRLRPFPVTLDVPAWRARNCRGCRLHSGALRESVHKEPHRELHQPPGVPQGVPRGRRSHHRRRPRGRRRRHRRRCRARRLDRRHLPRPRRPGRAAAREVHLPAPEGLRRRVHPARHQADHRPRHRLQRGGRLAAQPRPARPRRRGQPRARVADARVVPGLRRRPPAPGLRRAARPPRREVGRPAARRHHRHRRRHRRAHGPGRRASPATSAGARTSGRSPSAPRSPWPATACRPGSR